MLEQGVGDAVANTFASTGDDSDFTSEVGGLGEFEFVGCETVCATKVFGNGVLEYC